MNSWVLARVGLLIITILILDLYSLNFPERRCGKFVELTWKLRLTGSALDSGDFIEPSVWPPYDLQRFLFPLAWNNFNRMLVIIMMQLKQLIVPFLKIGTPKLLLLMTAQPITLKQL